jgi:hypothetical protein
MQGIFEIQAMCNFCSLPVIPAFAGMTEKVAHRVKYGFFEPRHSAEHDSELRIPKNQISENIILVYQYHIKLND